MRGPRARDRFESRSTARRRLSRHTGADHRADPLASLELSSGDYARLATIVRGYAPSAGRLAFFLEGGYDLDALRASSSATLGAIVGAGTRAEAPTSGGPGEQAVARAQAAHTPG